MRRTEAHRGVGMIKYLSVLSRYEAADMNQLEEAELLGMSGIADHVSGAALAFGTFGHLSRTILL